MEVDAPSGPGGAFENPVIDGKPAITVQLNGLKRKVSRPPSPQTQARKRLNTREEMIRFYVEMADNKELPAADRIRSADRIVDLLGFKISKDFGSVQRMTNSELIAAIEDVAPILEGYMTLRARGRLDPEMFAPEKPSETPAPHV